mmetsp:Transcript_24774/g.50105  ORF Transcript_24774/g.50105 Transcript_24774/m.50105 type:complete len:410 (-) Transcript_24774:73-1302(-)
MKKTWNTPFTQTFPCRIPLCSAPMAGVSGGLLASRVCQAGGLGFIAAGHFRDLLALEREIDIFFQNQQEQLTNQTQTKQSQSQPQTQQQQGAVATDNDAHRSVAAINKLSIGFIGHSSLSTKEGWENYEYILRTYQPLAVQFFAPSIVYKHNDNFDNYHSKNKNDHNDETNVTMAKKYGTKFIAQVGSIQEAQEAMRHDVDAIICQGSEAGGHGLRRNLGNSTMALTSQVSRLIKSNCKTTASAVIPVLAAGGIVAGKHLVSALCLCDGVVLGTRFWASNESIGNPALQQSLLKNHSCDDVIRTTIFDRIENELKSSCKWPQPYDSVGALRNRTTREWEGKSEVEWRDAMDGSDLLERYKSSAEKSDGDVVCVLAGEGVGEIDSIEGAYDIVMKIEEEALEIIDRLKSI